ncbi:ATP-binding protein [Desulfobacter latus]|uniref:ATP-binding protein n=1 Tax=Desulfobacter latus TaxID=2292 RepID=A0A850T6L6_9BACT|nr:DUF499 domain-containing protein [Desulfobacter latus]NWH05012.1 ATP-binding protein [Desulfobacter latus]
MSLKPWREVARPHKDVLEGTFKQSEFAADISQVVSGVAPPEYQDAEKFFSRTFITEGMRLLLISVARRLAGQGGDPVIQLQTAFGGGKTHTLLAVMHLAQQEVGTDRMEGIPPILDEAGIQDMPGAKVAVLDGIRLSPSQSIDHDGVTIHTLWGELAWQLLGEAGYALVADSDADGTSPGKAILQKLIEKASPCVILMDELLAFVRQLEVGKAFKAGTFDSNISFIQALTEAMKLVPDAILLASLPESELEAGGSMGQRVLNALETYFARVESVWKPVASIEAFEIVRRRLFEHAGSPSEVDGICRQFSEFYREHGNKFPQDTQSNNYFERLCQSYPIHPEVFDRLYEDWSTLDKFQRTRGVLQYMAIVIHRLWKDGNSDILIMPGSLPLYDSNVRNKSIHYLPQGWEPVLEREVDGKRSEPDSIDGNDTRFGAVQAARRAMRTIFLGSAPTVSNQNAKGLRVDQILLGSVQPGQTIQLFEDVLRRLHDRLQYLYFDDNRFWLDTKPNLRREMESRKRQIDTQTKLIPFLKDRTGHLFGKRNTHCFAGIHIFTSSVDIPDDTGAGPRLVLLSPDPLYAFSKGDAKNACAAAEEILRKRGDQPRQKQNRLIFMVPDFDALSRLKDHAKTYLAWNEILSDIDEGKLNLDLFQINQAKKYRDNSDRSLNPMIRETYKWILCPLEEIVNGKPTLTWESISISTTSSNFSSNIESTLTEEEWLISQWSPIHLKGLLDQWYFKEDQQAINALKVWQDSCNYLYFPRLLNDGVFKDALKKGLESTAYFGFASGKEGDDYLDFCFGDGAGADITLDDHCVIISSDAAQVYQKHITASSDADTDGTGATDIDTDSGDGGQVDPKPTESKRTTSDGGRLDPDPSVQLKQFYGMVDLDPVKAKIDFATIVDEVIQQFTSKHDVNVSISIEVQAESPKGFDEGLQRTIKENCTILKFKNAEFEA